MLSCIRGLLIAIAVLYFILSVYMEKRKMICKLTETLEFVFCNKRNYFAISFTFFDCGICLSRGGHYQFVAQKSVFKRAISIEY